MLPTPPDASGQASEGIVSDEDRIRAVIATAEKAYAAGFTWRSHDYVAAVWDGGGIVRAEAERIGRLAWERRPRRDPWG